MLQPRTWLFLLILSTCASAAANDSGESSPQSSQLGDLGVTRLVGIITAIGALGTAAFSLVDASKAFNGGVSAVGLKGLYAALAPFSTALQRALGSEPSWRAVVRAHWINGRPREEQKAITRGLIRLGLSPETAMSIAAAAHVDPARLAEVAHKLEVGAALGEADLLVLGRLDASIEALLDAAYDRADQLYRNVSRLLAGVCAVVLSALGSRALGWGWDDWPMSLLVGLLAVPFAPIAKDLTSSLQAAAAALRSTKRS